MPIPGPPRLPSLTALHAGLLEDMPCPCPIGPDDTSGVPRLYVPACCKPDVEESEAGKAVLAHGELVDDEDGG
jgi:hypothetical protein